MMNTRILQPRGARVNFITVERWHLDICNQHQPAAAVLAFLVAYHNRRQPEKERAEIINDELKRKGRLASWNATDWQFHTDKQLERGVMLFKTDAIRSGRKYLEENQLIFTEPPTELKELFNTGRTKWFLVNFEKINKWLVEFFDSADIDVVPPPLALPTSEVEPNGDTSAAAKKQIGLTDTARRLHKFWQIKTGNEKISADRAQLQLIINRLKNGLTEFDIAHAIIGNKLEPFYVERLLHSLSLICKNNDKTAGFIKLAEKHGVNGAQARQEYETALGVTLGAQTPSKATPAPASAKAGEITGHYKRAAKHIVEFVRVQRLPAKEVVRIFKFQQFDFDVKIITDETELANRMIDILSADEIVDETKRKRTELYAKNLIEGLKIK